MKRFLKAHWRLFKVCFLYWRQADEWKAHRFAASAAVGVNLLCFFAQVFICHSWLALLNIFLIFAVIGFGYFSVYCQAKREIEERRKNEDRAKQC
jgi:hypothetical protein